MKYKELKKFHKAIDEELQFEKTVCKKCCNYCCYQSVELFSIEISSIKEFIVKILPDTIKKQLKQNTRKWLDFYYEYISQYQDLNLEHITVELNNVMVEKNIPCPFLINNICSIYSRRPISCRTYIQTQSVLNCKQNPLRNDDNKGRELHLYMATFFQTYSEVYLYPINFVLAEIFFPEEEVPMAKNLRENFNKEMLKLAKSKMNNLDF